MGGDVAGQLEVNNKLLQEIEKLFNDFQYTNSGEKKKRLF